MWSLEAARRVQSFLGFRDGALRLTKSSPSLDTSLSRSFGVSAAQSCEAARRALLSHGYLVQRSNADLVEGRKSFQPAPDSHVQIEFHVVCAQEGPEHSTVFVNALQDLYALKKSSTTEPGLMRP